MPGIHYTDPRKTSNSLVPTDKASQMKLRDKQMKEKYEAHKI